MKNTSFVNYLEQIMYVPVDTKMRIIDVMTDPHVKYQKGRYNERKTNYPVCQTDDNVLESVHPC